MTMEEVERLERLERELEKANTVRTEQFEEIVDLRRRVESMRNEMDKAHFALDERKEELTQLMWQLRDKKDDLRRAQGQIAELKEKGVDEAALSHAWRQIDVMRRLRKALPVELKTELAGVSEQNGLWRAVMEVLERVREGEVDMSLMPNLSDDMRHYRAGRASAVVDAEVALMEAWRVAKEVQSAE